MTHEEYITKKDAQRSIWLERVFATAMVDDEESLEKEALERFEKFYPPYKE